MLNTQNLNNLKAIFDFDPHSEDIFSVQGRMRALLEIYKSNEELSNLQDFLKVYLIVTEKVVDSRFQSKKLFQNPTLLNKLDVMFASYYFKAIKPYIFKGGAKSPWIKSSILSTQNNIPFANVLMGINSHINGDLALSLLELNFNNKEDYDKISRILNAVIPNILSYLAFERMDFFGASGLILQPLIESEFNKIIVKWREDAYSNYLFLKKSDNLKVHTKYIKDLAETASEKIYNIFKEELLNPINLVKNLNSIEVRL